MDCHRVFTVSNICPEMNIMNVRAGLIFFAIEDGQLMEIFSSYNIPVLRPVIEGANAMMQYNNRFA